MSNSDKASVKSKDLRNDELLKNLQLASQMFQKDSLVNNIFIKGQTEEMKMKTPDQINNQYNLPMYYSGNSGINFTNSVPKKQTNPIFLNNVQLEKRPHINFSNSAGTKFFLLTFYLKFYF
jgi:hypothetical protein